MSITQNAQDILRAHTFAFPPGYPLVRVEVDHHTELTGDDALRVLAVIDENVDLEHINGKEVGEFKAAIRECLVESGINLFPYVFFAKPSELAEDDEDMDE